MKFFIIFFFSILTFTQSSYATNYSKLRELVQLEIDLLEKSKIEGDEVHYRLFELYSERLKLTFYHENQSFLKNEDPVKHQNKRSYFPETQKIFQSTQEFGNAIIKKFPKTKRKADVLYTLALNSRDFNGGEGSEKLLKESLKNADKPGQAFHARSSLAETLYNEKKYAEAVNHYEVVVQNQEDSWLPKHWLNLGWCYLKTDRMDQAINALEQAYQLSGTKKYIDIKGQVAQNMVPFWVQAGKVEQGMEYFKKNVSDPFENFIQLAKRAADKGFVKETEQIFSETQKLSSYKSNIDRQEELLAYQLIFYRQMKRWDEHSLHSQKYLDLKRKTSALKPIKKLSQEQEVLEEIKGVAGFHQMSLSKDITKNGSDQYNKKDVEYVIKYFNLLQELHPDEKALYLYYLAESYFGIKEYEKAFNHYEKSLAFFMPTDKKDGTLVRSSYVSKEKNDLDKLILSSLLALMAEEPFSKEINQERLITTYDSYLKIRPNDEIAKDIYPKLYKLYLVNKNNDSATFILKKYVVAFPADKNLQQENLKELLNFYIEQKNDVKLALWIDELKKGYLSFKKEDIEKTELVLADILFYQAFRLNENGDSKNALLQFEKVYKTTSYPVNIRAQSAFHAGEISLDNNNKSSAISWLEKSLQVNQSQHLQKSIDEWVKILDKLAYLYELRGAVRLYNVLLDKTCLEKTEKQDILFQKTALFHQVLSDDYLLRTFLKKNEKCVQKEETILATFDEIMKNYADLNNFSLLKDFFYRSPHKPIEKYGDYLISLYWENTDERSDIVKELKIAKSENTVAYYSLIEKLNNFNKRLDTLLNVKIAHLAPFDPEKFSESLDLYLKDIQVFIEDNKELSKLGDIYSQSFVFKKWWHFYNKLSDKIYKLDILENDPDLVKSFKEEMQKVAKPFAQEGSRLVKLIDQKPNGDRSSSFVNPIYLSSSFNSSELQSNMYLDLCLKDNKTAFLEKALAHFKQSPKDWKYWAQLGNCLLWNGEIRESRYYLSFAESLAERANEKAEVQFMRAVLYLKLNRVHKGFEYLELSQASLPQNRLVAYNLSLIYLHFDQYQKAKDYLNSQNEENPEVVYLKALTFLGNQKTRELRQMIGRLPANFIERDDASLLFAKVNLMEENWIEAEKILGKRTTSKYPLLESRAKELRIEIESQKLMRFK